MKDLISRIENDFTYHPPGEGTAGKYIRIREKAKELALLLAAEVPPGREQSTALTRLEEAVFHANAGISRHKQTAAA